MELVNLNGLELFLKFIINLGLENLEANSSPASFEACYGDWPVAKSAWQRDDSVEKTGVASLVVNFLCIVARR